MGPKSEHAFRISGDESPFFTIRQCGDLCAPTLVKLGEILQIGASSCAPFQQLHIHVLRNGQGLLLAILFANLRNLLNGLRGSRARHSRTPCQKHHHSKSRNNPTE